MRAHEIIGILVIPGRTEAEKSVGNLDTLWQDRCLRFCQALGEEKFENLLTDASLQGFGIRYCKSVDPRFSYVCSAIISLLRLHAEITELTSKFNSGLVTPVLAPPCIISASQRDKIIKLVQYVIALEVLPNLLPGVGIPLKKRSEYAHELLDQASASNVSDVEKYDRLSFTTRALLKIASDPNLGCLIYSTSLPDILAALLQLCYAPIKEPDPKSTCTLVTPVLYSRFMAERREFKSQLDHLIATVYRPPLIKSLLLLQGAPKNLDTLPKVGPLVIAPVWLRAVCAEKLTSCLMQYNGIIYVAEATLGYYCDGSVDLNRINAVSQLIATPPKEVGIHSYYRVIAPQVVSLLKTSNPQTQPAFLQLGFRIIQLMMEKNSEITYKFLLKPVFLPLLQCLDSTVSEKCEIPDEFQLSQCLEEVKKVFVDNAQPGESVQAYLKSILIVLFKIYSCVFYGASYLRSTVEEILLRSLQNNSTAENIQVFELLAFNRLEKGMFPLKKGLTFKSGEEGGIVATFDENEENWLVSDDEKAIIIVDLMTKQGDSETLSQFFLHLLKRLGSIIDPLEEDSDPEGDDFESKLLRIEKQLDDKMFKLKESLMVVRLISLLSESEGIQDVIMKDQVKVVEFTKMTLQRVAIQIEESAERQLIDKESVCLAIGVLASLTSSASKVKNSLWDQLQTVVPDLDNLMNRHPDQEVRECAEDLKIVIASRGIYTNEMAKRMRKEKTKLEKEKKIVEELSNKEAVFENLKNVVIDPAIKLKEEVMNLYPNKKDDESIKEGFKEALEYLNDPMIPVKGHGLILLSKLVQNKDTPTIENKEKLLNIFKVREVLIYANPSLDRFHRPMIHTEVYVRK
ncbi:transport and Golgi organization protein 6 homolog [Artemia franciscana]|uniref:Uncharacterized protein n=1 Tax=Artemia franciscana TaxID=6661 RepID=A0AA88KRC0_ARTSF|nr:hypothetical protein QYM36_018782 [Artemia franciscana]